jgi:hypothetical protein
MFKEENLLVRSLMLCEALHAFGPTADELYADDKFVEAKTLDEYVKCKLGLFDGATQEVVKCKQAALNEPRTRVVCTKPAHGMEQLLGQEWWNEELC